MKNFRKPTKASLDGLCAHCAAAATAQYADCERALGEIDKRVDVALAHARLSQQSKRFLKELWYGEPQGALSLGNRAVYAAAMMASIKVALQLAHNDPTARKGKLRLRMLTTTPDAGTTLASNPRVDGEALRRNFYMAARAANMDALGFVDLAQIVDRDTLNPATICGHMHGISRGRDRDFSVVAAEERATPARNPTNQAGIKAVKISSKKKNRGPGLTRAEVSYLAYYVRKISCGFKVIYSKDGKRQTVTTLHGWGLLPALGQLECLSHLDALQTTCGVGEGKRWRSQWKRQLFKLLKVQVPVRGSSIDHEVLERGWSRLRGELSASTLGE